MKTSNHFFAWTLTIASLVTIGSCSPENVTTSTLYTPTSADVTSTATLQQLQQGRELYINNCGTCHHLYTPETYSTAQWQNIVAQMAPKTRMVSAEVDLVLKYVTKGQS